VMITIIKLLTRIFTDCKEDKTRNFYYAVTTSSSEHHSELLYLNYCEDGYHDYILPKQLQINPKDRVYPNWIDIDPAGPNYNIVFDFSNNKWVVYSKPEKPTNKSYGIKIGELDLSKNIYGIGYLFLLMRVNIPSMYECYKNTKELYKNDRRRDI